MGAESGPVELPIDGLHAKAGTYADAGGTGVPYEITNQGPTEHDNHPTLSLRLVGDVSVVFPLAVNAALGDSQEAGLEGRTAETRLVVEGRKLSCLRT